MRPRVDYPVDRLELYGLEIAFRLPVLTVDRLDHFYRSPSPSDENSALKAEIVRRRDNEKSARSEITRLNI